MLIGARHRCWRALFQAVPIWLFLPAALAAAGGPGTSTPLAKRAAALSAERQQAASGRLPEYLAAQLTLISCAEALAKPDPELRRRACETAQASVDACEQRRASWIESHDQFTIDALAKQQSKRYADLIKAQMPPCPDTVPGQMEGPAAALSEQGRRERRERPGFMVCESYLRAMLEAADRMQAERVDQMALELVFRCGDDHPDYRAQAIAALSRVGHDAQVVLRRLRGSSPASAASSP